MLVARGQIERRQAIVKIGFQPFIPETHEVGPLSTSVPIPVHEYRALIDTGAQRTCLSRSVIGQEMLRPHGKRPIQNVHGTERHYLYWVNLGFVCERLDSLLDRTGSQTYYGLPEPREIIDIADNFWFQAIIGMDVLGQCAFRMERDGAFALILE